MKKNLIPQALAILVGIANAPSSFAMDDPSEQNRNFQSALRHLNDLGEAQKKEADLKAKIEKKTINLETMNNPAASSGVSDSPPFRRILE